MSQTNCLYELIHEVDAATPLTAPGDKRVGFHVGLQRIFTSRLFRPADNMVKYFLVSTTAVANCVVSVIHVVDNGERGRAVGLKVELEVRCPAGNEERVVEAFAGDPNPSAVLAAKIREWSREYLSQQPNFFASFAVGLLDLETHLTAKARAEIGLDVLVEISLYHDPTETYTTSVGPLDLQVELRDHTGLFRVRLIAELAADNLIDAVAHRGERENFSDEVRQGAQRYFAETVSVAQLFRERDHVAAGLKEYLNERLRAVGQRVQTLRLETDETVHQQVIEVSQRVEYKGLAQPEPIIVTDVARISVQDYGIYLGSNTPDLSQWLAHTLNEVTQETLNGKSYPNILVELRAISRDITNQISSRAGAIGCGIQQHVTITSPTLDRWSKEIEIATEEAFATLFERFQVRLKIVVSVALIYPEKAIAYLERGMDLPDLLKRRISDEVRRVLLGVHPIRLCERIISSEEPSEEPVKVVLDRSVRERLVRDFDVEPISVSIEIMDTGFSKSLNNFWNENIVFDAELFSQNTREGSPVVYSFDCQIDEMTSEGWKRTAVAGFDFPRFKTQLINALKGELENYDPAEVGGGVTRESAVRVKEGITALVTHYALAEFGLELRIRSVRRKITEAERKFRESAAANELERIELVRKLESDVLKLIAAGTKAEELARWRARIAELKAYSVFVVPDARERTWPTNDPANGNSAAVALREDWEVRSD